MKKTYMKNVKLLLKDALVLMVGLFLFVSLMVCSDCGRKAINPRQTIQVGKGPDALYLTENEKHLYVANVEDKIVSVIDTHTNKVIKKLPVALGPWGFAVIGNGLLAVSSWKGEINIINESKITIVRTFKLPFHAGGIVSSSDRKSLYVVAVDKNRVHQIDPNSGRSIKTIVTEKGPDGIGLSGSDKFLYVANTIAGTIEVFELPSAKKIKGFKVGGKPELVHSSHDGTRLFISNFKRGLVHVIDSAKHKMIGEIKGLDGPEEAIASRNDTVLYVALFNKGLIRSFDAKTLQPLPQTYRTGKKPIGIMPTGNGGLYISNFADNSITFYKIQ